MEYKKEKALFILPRNTDVLTVLNSLGKFYIIDRISEPIEDEPLLLFIEEIERDKKESPEDIVEPIPGGEDHDSLIP